MHKRASTTAQKRWAASSPCNRMCDVIGLTSCAACSMQARLLLVCWFTHARALEGCVQAHPAQQLKGLAGLAAQLKVQICLKHTHLLQGLPVLPLGWLSWSFEALRLIRQSWCTKPKWVDCVDEAPCLPRLVASRLAQEDQLLLLCIHASGSSGRAPSVVAPPSGSCAYPVGPASASPQGCVGCGLGILLPRPGKATPPSAPLLAGGGGRKPQAAGGCSRGSAQL